MVIIGWDWASDKHDLVRLDELGEVAARWRIAHSGAALQQVAVELAALAPEPGQVVVGIEQHDGPVIGFLQGQGFRVHPLNPHQVKAARTAFCNSPAKDDRRDAWVIARLLHRDRDSWRQAAPADGPADELRAFCELHDVLTEQSIRVQQQLRALLMSWAPELNNLIPELTSKWARDFLVLCPLPQAMARIHPRTWAAFCRQHRLPQTTQAPLRGLARQPLMPIPEARVAPLALQIGQLATQLDLLCNQLAELHRRTRKSWADYPDRELFASLPIAEGYLIHRIAAAFGTDRRQPLTWRQVAIHLGVAPVTIASGKFRTVHRRRGCDLRAQRAITHFAFLSMRSQPWARDLYHSQRLRGNSHHAALRQLARKWLRIIYCLWYHHKPYDPAIPKSQLPPG